MTPSDYTTPRDTFVGSIDIHTLLPQQEPYVMVERMTHFDTLRTVTTTMVKEDNTLVEDSHLTEAGLLENVAQTCAARIGYINRQSSEGVRLGFIGAIRNLNILRLPKVGETLSTTITVVEEVFGMTLVNAVVKVADEVIAQTEMKIALSDIVAQG